jgi:hypothetical protein
MLSELDGHSPAGNLVGCLGPPDASAQVVGYATDVRQQCVGDWPPSAAVGVSFDGVAHIEALLVPTAAEAGQPLEARLLWRPLVAHPEPHQMSLQLDDPTVGDGTLSGNATLDVYPSGQWEPAETVLSRLPLRTDSTALPQPYRLTLGISPPGSKGAPASALWQGTRTHRVPIATVVLTPSTASAMETMPADMRPVEGPPLVGGGLELIGMRPLPAEASVGGPLKIGLLWRALHDAPEASHVKWRLLRANGEIAQESMQPLLGGRLTPGLLRAGNVVRDEQTLLIDARVPPEPLALELDVLDTRVRLGSVKMTGRAHVFDPTAPAQATFGPSIQLIKHELEPAQARPNEKVTVRLRWRSAAAMTLAYKIFVHVLDPKGEKVVAQRDAEPQDGRAPTTAWVVGEVIDDEYAMTLPAGLASGEYPVEIGVYDARTGDRLPLPNGDTRVILDKPLRVR